MSRLASKPIVFDSAVKVTLRENEALVKGPRGELVVPISKGITVTVEETQVRVDRTSDDLRAHQGLVWSLLHNAIVGVTTGFTKKLEIVGKGWRSTVKGNIINLQVGHTHPVDFELPKGVSATQENPGAFTLTSHDKQLLGQTAANIKSLRPIEPYKLKGIRITGQPIRQKQRKAAGV